MKKILYFALVASILFGCCSVKKVVPEVAIKGNWNIVEAAGVATQEGFNKASISFEEGGKVNGTTSVNSFFGSYTVSGDSLSFSNVGMTRVMGDTMETEDAVVNGINTASLVKFTDKDTAHVYDSEGIEVLKLERVK